MSQEDGTTRSVLIIDDVLGYAESLADLLQPKGYTATIVDTPERALAALREPPAGTSPPPVALVDVRLGGVEFGGRSDPAAARRAAGADLRADDHRYRQPDRDRGAAQSRL